MEAWRLEATDIAAKVRRGELRAREAAESVLDRAEALESKVRAYVSVEREHVLARADEIDRIVAGGSDPGLLGGVPIAVKDNMCTGDADTTCSSRILEGFRPPFSATVVEKLLDAGAVVLGKTNMDEFAMGSSTENSGFYPTRNPWDLSRVPGGSSGGSAAAVACGSAVCALGSDTGGSIRQPASLCGVVGFKPTYGRVSRYGLVAFGSSLDQIGPLTRSVRDCALVSRVISGHDPMDATSIPVPVDDYPAALDGLDLRGTRLGVPREYFVGGIQSDVEEKVREGTEMLRGLGAEVKEIGLPHTEYAVAVYYVVATAEASSNLARYDGVHYGHRASPPGGIVEMYSKSRSGGFGAEVKRRIMLGTFSLSSGYYDAYYLKALKVRNLIKTDFDRAWEEVDYVVTPTSPTVAFKLGEKTQDPLSMYLSDMYTIAANLAALPAISVPCGLSAEGLPVGFQIMGKRLDEKGVLRVAAALEGVARIEPHAPVDPEDPE